MKLVDAIETAERACGYSDAYQGDHIFNVVAATLEYAMENCSGPLEVAIVLKRMKREHKAAKEAQCHRKGKPTSSHFRTDTPHPVTSPPRRRSRRRTGSGSRGRSSPTTTGGKPGTE